MPEPLKITLAVVLVVGALALCLLSVHSVKQADDGSANYALTPAAKAQSAPDFRLPNAVTGATVSLQDAEKSGPVVLDFWATWCGPCRQELPHIAALAKKFRGRVQFYGVNSNDKPAQIQAFFRQFPPSFPTLVDARQTVGMAYGASAIPLTVLIDRQGRVRLLASGYDPQADVEGDLSDDLNTLLAEH
jgi:thiol-disulfide isomerase/thioredoxin